MPDVNYCRTPEDVDVFADAPAALRRLKDMACFAAVGLLQST